MANLEAQEEFSAFESARRHARRAGYVQRAQLMILAGGMTAFGIVAVAASMMTTLL